MSERKESKRQKESIGLQAAGVYFGTRQLLESKKRIGRKDVLALHQDAHKQASERGFVIFSAPLDE